ncbi:1,4-alpha-glucan branching enzyme GlgB [compost metagenome]
MVVAVNFTPAPLAGYRIGVPHAGRYVEVLNSDSTHYGGSDLGNGGAIEAALGEWMRRPANLAITLPPLAVVLLRPVTA